MVARSDCMWKGFEHKNIVTLYGVCLDDPALVMKLMPKGNLYDLLHGKEKLTWKVRYKLMIGIAKGVKYLHENGIVHRDLKSFNILIGKNHRPKICDFGLAETKKDIFTKKTTTAQKTTTKNKANTNTNKGKMVGTLLWMAPELLNGAKCTKASDNYALGKVFGEIVSGEVPWKDITSDQIIINKVTKGDKEPIPKNCPKAVEQIIIKCCNRHAFFRPSAEEVIKRLKEHKEEIQKYVP